MQICFLTKRKKKIGKYTAKVTFLWYDNFGKKERSLCRNGMAAIPKRKMVWKQQKSSLTSMKAPESSTNTKYMWFSLPHV